MYKLSGNTTTDYEVEVVACGTSSLFTPSNYVYKTDCNSALHDVYTADGYADKIGFKVLSVITLNNETTISWDKDFLETYMSSMSSYDGYFVSLYDSSQCYTDKFAQGLVYFENKCVPSVSSSDPIDQLSGLSSYYRCSTSYSTEEIVYNSSIDCGNHWTEPIQSINNPVANSYYAQQSCPGPVSTSPTSLAPLTRGFGVAYSCSTSAAPPSSTDDSNTNDDHGSGGKADSVSLSGTLTWLIPLVVVFFIGITFYMVWNNIYKVRKAVVQIQQQKDAGSTQLAAAHQRTTPGGGMNVNVDLNGQPIDNPIFHSGAFIHSGGHSGAFIHFGGAPNPNVRYAYEDGGPNDHIPNNSNPYGQAAEEAPPSYNEAVRPSEENRYEAEMTGVNRGLPPPGPPPPGFKKY